MPCHHHRGWAVWRPTGSFWKVWRKTWKLSKSDFLCKTFLLGKRFPQKALSPANLGSWVCLASLTACLFLMGILMFGQSFGRTIYELIVCLFQKMCSRFALPGTDLPFRTKMMMTMIEDMSPVLYIYMCKIFRNRYLHLPGYGSDKVHSQQPAWAQMLGNEGRAFAKNHIDSLVILFQLFLGTFSLVHQSLPVFSLCLLPHSIPDLHPYVYDSSGFFMQTLKEPRTARLLANTDGDNGKAPSQRQESF